MPETGNKPFLLVTMDTEGDDLWSGSREIGTRNARLLPRFQALCERYSLRPTWLVSYEMAVAPAFVEFARDVLERKAGEIGMHLHAWNTPPPHPLSGADHAGQPYLTEYPDRVMEEKIGFMTALLEDTFQAAVASHRAGRWGFDARYARMLAARGYLVDCSVTPHVSWRRYPGAPGGSGGPDFRGFPERSYFLDRDDISREGDLPLLEVPVTIVRRGGAARRAAAAAVAWNPLLARALDRASRPVSWLRPNGRNRLDMAAILEDTFDRGKDYAEFMLHSSELMPGGSPRFRTAESVEALYRDIEYLFDAAAGRFRGSTLREYHAWHAAR
ncbi:MAG: deacetylase [Candidatus Krumholzibacteria bacterium]|nr:deacetylase [Candidatus Krumholzibacteria bacterium]